MSFSRIIAIQIFAFDLETQSVDIKIINLSQTVGEGSRLWIKQIRRQLLDEIVAGDPSSPPIHNRASNQN